MELLFFEVGIILDKSYCNNFCPAVSKIKVLFIL